MGGQGQGNACVQPDKDSPNSASHDEALLHGASLLDALLQGMPSCFRVVKLSPQLLQLPFLIFLTAQHMKHAVFEPLQTPFLYTLNVLLGSRAI